MHGEFGRHLVTNNVQWRCVERMLHAQKARAFAEQEDNRLSSLIPAPQEFHKEIRLMQVRLQIDMDN